MLNNNKSLIVIENSLFKKVINYFKKLFKIKTKNILDENLSTSNNEKQLEEEAYEENNVFLQEGALEVLNNNDYNSNFVEHDFKQDLNYEEEKEKIFNVYSNIKSGKIGIDELDNITLIQINQMFKAEIDLKMHKKFA